uniref:Uncharacterized protein n=1 Tax=Dermatophagoides pteronyssinus virus 5 TaxID=2851132 RepID=A0A8F3E452_9VIRU|nr:hypothetical protein 1 [Dermatophagoides pteronyssinus virus 5]
MASGLYPIALRPFLSPMMCWMVQKVFMAGWFAIVCQPCYFTASALLMFRPFHFRLIRMFPSRTSLLITLLVRLILVLKAGTLMAVPSSLPSTYDFCDLVMLNLIPVLLLLPWLQCCF